MGKMKSKITVPAVCRVPISMVFVGICVMFTGGFLQNTKTTATYSTSVPAKTQTELSLHDGATQSVVTDWRTITEYHQKIIEKSKM